METVILNTVWVGTIHYTSGIMKGKVENLYNIFCNNETRSRYPLWGMVVHLEENSLLHFKELGEFKPYLIPFEKLPQEKGDEYDSLLVLFSDNVYYDTIKSINWCYENHVDINGLIDLGLANDATGLNIY